MADLHLGPGAIVVILLYLASTILIGWAGRRAAKEKTLADFFLAGRAFGTFTLLMTLFATQYSGNSFIGFPGQSYRIGFAFLYSVTAMQAIIVFYLLFAPRLHAVAHEAKLITPGDYLLHRYKHRGLHVVATAVMIFALSNYVLTQMKAMGHLLEGVTQGAIPFGVGVLFLALIMVIYETLGGMRSVAWTDVLQGGMLFIGAVGIVVLIHSQTGGIGAAAALVAERYPEKVGLPTAQQLRTWVSTVLIIGAGASVYPQAIQRIYAAGSAAILRRSLGIMVFLPLVATTFTVFVGITALAYHPGLEDGAADRAMPLVLASLLESGVVGYWLVVLVVSAALAAIMSTADSGLLTLSSMFTRDLLQRYLLPGLAERSYHRAGKAISWGIMGLMCIMAMATSASIWSLLVLKFEVLLQIFPAFVLGTRSPRTDGNAVLAGLVAGCVVALGLFFSGHPKVWGFHAGLIGVAVNFATVLCLQSFASLRSTPVRD